MQLLKSRASSSRNASVSPITFLAALLHVAGFLPYFTNAFGADTINQEDHNHPRILDLQSESYASSIGGRESEIGGYAPDFLGFDRSIIGRADDVTQLQNNVPGKNNIAAEDTQYYVFSKADLQGSQSPQTSNSRSSSLLERGTAESSPVLGGSYEDRQAGPQRRQTNNHTLYVTLNICDQPGPTSPTINGAPPPLQLYISTNAKNPKPNANNREIAVPVLYGLGSYTLNASSDVYIGVTAPAKSPNFEGLYSYELTASTDQPYTSYIDEAGMVFIDSDVHSALLSADSTANLSSYSIFVHNQQNTAVPGLQYSFCGLKNQAQIQGNINGSATGDVDIGMMSLGGASPQQHFHVRNLSGSSAYYGMMAIEGNLTTATAGSGVIGGGGTVWKSVNFTTKSSDNCAVIFNLSFCSDVAYAVPSNPKTQPDIGALTQLYDNFAKDLYQNFSYSLQQIPCNTTSSAQYSLARNCTSCANAYKTWLCAVTIPRCEQFSNNAPFLQPRAVGFPFPNGTVGPPINATDKIALFMNSSRNPMIDQQIVPGPYKEILPCVDLCYDLIQSCPASLGFACPLERHGLNYTYGNKGTTGGIPTCNYPGAAFGRSAAIALQGNIWFMTAMLLVGFTVGFQ